MLSGYVLLPAEVARVFVEGCGDQQEVDANGEWELHGTLRACELVAYHQHGESLSAGVALFVPAGGDLTGLVLDVPARPDFQRSGELVGRAGQLERLRQVRVTLEGDDLSEDIRSMMEARQQQLIEAHGVHPDDADYRAYVQAVESGEQLPYAFPELDVLGPEFDAAVERGDLEAVEALVREGLESGRLRPVPD